METRNLLLLAMEPDKGYRFKNFIKNNDKKESNTQRFQADGN